MVIDSSALISILLFEPEAGTFISAITNDEIRLLSAPNLVETSLVMEGRKSDTGRIELNRFVRDSGIEIVSFDEAHAEAARMCWRTYGKGRHPAKLNLGDCFSYALAKVTGEPLLFKGNDFHLTDVEPVL